MKIRSRNYLHLYHNTLLPAYMGLQNKYKCMWMESVKEMIFNLDYVTYLYTIFTYRFGSHNGVSDVPNNQSILSKFGDLNNDTFCNLPKVMEPNISIGAK